MVTKVNGYRVWQEGEVLEALQHALRVIAALPLTDRDRPALPRAVWPAVMPDRWDRRTQTFLPRFQPSAAEIAEADLVLGALLTITDDRARLVLSMRAAQRPWKEIVREDGRSRQHIDGYVLPRLYRHLAAKMTEAEKKNHERGLQT